MARILVVLSDAGINVRQAVVSDPQDLSDSHLIIVADGSIPGDIMTQIRGCPGVASVIIR
jgi:predicted regulator of amino acid metabolism with ACT domain